MSTIAVSKLPGHKGQYAVRADYFSHALIDVCREVPGMHYDGPTGWVGYADAVTDVVERLNERNITCDGEVREPDWWKKATLTIPVAKSDRAYQNEGVKFLVSMASEGCLLADGMRVGKSLQATLAARAFKQRTLITCPPNAVGVWGRPPSHPKPGEIAKWWPDAWKNACKNGIHEGPGVVVLEGVAHAKDQDELAKLREKKTRKPAEEELLRELEKKFADLTWGLLSTANVVIVHHEILYAWVEVLLRWSPGLFILDEIHAFSSYDTRRSRAAKVLARAAPRRIGLSGTPMTNRPRDLHNVCDLLSEWRFGPFFTHPREDKPWHNFASEFCDAKQKDVGNGPEKKSVWDFDGASQQDLLHKRLRHFMLRRTAREVDAQLPAKQRQIVDVAVPAKAAVMPTGDIVRDRKRLRLMLDMAADGKFKQVVDLLKSHLEEGEKVVVFCHRRKFAEALVKACAKTAPGTFVHGDVSMKKREERIVEAESSPGAFLFAATIETCATAIDLSFARTAVFAELTWEPHELAQAEERIYKFGSGEKLFIQYIIARGTGDELILRSVIAKLDDFEKVIGATGDQMRQHLKADKKKGDALDRLYESLMAMQKEKAA